MRGLEVGVGVCQTVSWDSSDGDDLKVKRRLETRYLIKEAILHGFQVHLNLAAIWGSEDVFLPDDVGYMVANLKVVAAGPRADG